MVKIRLLNNNEKFNYIEKIMPGFLYNRFDILYDKKFELLEIEYETIKYYVPFHNGIFTCELGLWLSEIPAECIKEIIKYIFNKYMFIFYIKISSSVNDFDSAIKHSKEINFWIDLPDNVDDYINSLSRNVRYNLRRREKRLKEDFGDYQIIRYDGQAIPLNAIKFFFKLKKKSKGKQYKMSPKEYLKKYFVTSASILKIQNKMIAITLISETGDYVYMENGAFEPEYSKYGIGRFLFVDTVCDAILRKKKQLFFGASVTEDYKKTICNKERETYCLKFSRFKQRG